MGRLVRAMGGSLRAKMGVEITHLVAPTSSGVKVRFAQNYRIPVVSAEWIYAAWARRHEQSFLEPGTAAAMVSTVTFYHSFYFDNNVACTFIKHLKLLWLAENDSLWASAYYVGPLNLKSKSLKYHKYSSH